MTPLQTKAYISGLRAALRGGKKPQCPYDRPKLGHAWQCGYDDGINNPDDAVRFLVENKSGS